MKFYVPMIFLLFLSLILSPWIVFSLTIVTIVIYTRSLWWLFAFGVWLDILFANYIVFYQVELPFFTLLASILIPLIQALYKRINLSISL